MDAFKCHSWLHITLSELDNITYVKIDQEDSHVPYVPIDIPEDVKDPIVNNLKWTPTQVSIYILLLVYWCANGTFEALG